MKLYRLTRHGRPLASFHANQIEEDDLRLKDSVALAVGGKSHDSIRRGTVRRYCDGAITVQPRRKTGQQCTDRSGDLVFYTLTPYWHSG